MESPVAIKDDTELDLPEVQQLLERVQKEIGQSHNEVRRAMNAFVLAVGTHVLPLSATAIRMGERIGVVSVDVGNTACAVSFAPDAIREMQKRGVLGKKRKSAKC